MTLPSDQQPAPSGDTAERSPNRLIHETSPYLLQHASNPVDWYPWSEEAFAKAQAENKPVFLSVGYSACHWCHVMEHESFENEEIARILNEHYVSIKVDREERPDVDQIYMSAVQLITRRGGWPMSVFLTPEGKPFYGGTYWPPVAKMGMPGFRDILLKLHDYWVHKRDEVDTSADELVEAIQRMAAPVFESAELNEQALRRGMNDLLSSADRRNGGFGTAPKFPHPMDVRLLLRGWKRFDHEEALDIAVLTLEKMARGGIYDHLGGGFHRYSTDAHWLVPHFEKMLYDNALLVPAYLEAYQITRRDLFATVARETLEYVLREMTAPEGGFYSTQDADSEGEEGKFFVWTQEEIARILGEQDAETFSYCYDVTPQGNWEGKTILNRPKPHEEAARMRGIDAEELDALLRRCRETLLEARSRRVAPARDEKILVAWNGLMLTAMAQGGIVLEEERFVTAARQAADFILRELRDERGRLLHSYKDGQARFTAYLDDYACLIDGLTELFQATSEGTYLEAAVSLAEEMIDHFSDPEQGGFFYTADDHEKLITRTRDAQDNAVPSGNGMAATALLKLARLTGRSDLGQVAVCTLDSLSGLLVEHPRAAGQSLLALEFLLGPSPEIVLSEGTNRQELAEMSQVLANTFVPNRVFLRWGPDMPTPLVQDLLEGKNGSSAESCVFICERGRCQVPAATAEDLRQQLRDLGGSA
jgi:uncharacterized protein